MKKDPTAPFDPIIDRFPPDHPAWREPHLIEEVEVVPAPVCADASMIMAGALALLHSCNRSAEDLDDLQRHLGVEIIVVVSNIYEAMLAAAQYSDKKL